MQTTPTQTRTRPTPASDAALLRAIAPTGAEEFLAGFWERKPLHVERGEPGRFDDLLSARDVERQMSEPGLRTPGFRLVKAGAKLDPRDYTVDLSWRPKPFTGSADNLAVAREFMRGATVVLQGLHLTWTSLARYCRELEAFLGHPVQANAYYTPARSQGLPVHHDTHDVLVLQVAGTKRWLVYDPVFELPLKHQRYREEMGDPGPAVMDVVMRPGDTLYLPRGWLHEALTSEDDSLHLTIGVSVITWLDALRDLLAECEDDVEFRRSVPVDGEGAAELVELLAERVGGEQIAELVRSKFVAGRRPVLDGQLDDLRAVPELSADSAVARRATVIADLTDADDGRVALVFEGRRVVFPDHAQEELAALMRSTDPVRLSDLPGRLDDEGRLVLARRLVREGFLRVAAV
jgi:bifunctional lysine-specific demethylase and histidyl-hydroxylase NO66